MWMKNLMMPLVTGLTIFLFGMQVMRIGFEHLFLKRMSNILAVLTKNAFTGLLTGIVVTAILQSSSAVTLIVIGLAHSRIITLRQALGIVLGTNIGTCLTMELVAFNINQFALPLFVLGCFLFVQPWLVGRYLGLAFGGFGLLLIGMQTMQAILPFLKQSGWLAGMFSLGSEGTIKGVLAGTVLTAIIQSSTATTALTMNLMYEQLIPLSVAIAIVLGSNIGTCMTAILGSAGLSKTAKQVTVAHVLLNVFGVLLFFPLIPYLELVVISLSNSPMQQVAHAQTIFNILCSLIVLPFVHAFEKLILWLTK